MDGLFRVAYQYLEYENSNFKVQCCAETVHGTENLTLHVGGGYTLVNSFFSTYGTLGIGIASEEQC